jgi:tryptophan synthase alpha chain
VRSRLAKAFSRSASNGRPLLVAFVECGDPDLATTERIVLAAAAAGAGVVELGVPFSDPIADGPTIQRASERALAAGGGLDATLEVAAKVRSAGCEVPLVLFTYANPILATGEEGFARRAAAAGVDGVLVTDLPPEEGAGFARLLRAHALDPIYLLAPTSTDERLRRAAALSRGFVYLVSRAGVTGARASLPEELPSLVARVRSATKLPVAVGFGIATPEQAREAARLADGVVVGSALVAAIEDAVRNGADPVAAASALVRPLAEAMTR